jgi:hypothetical protein
MAHAWELPMTDSDHDERRQRYLADYKDTVDRHRAGALFYEKRAVDFANSALKVLTYLNGGGLIAIPATVGLFHADPKDVRVLLLCAAAAFIAGLVLVAIAQACAFFVMARRSESEVLFQFEQMELLKAVHYPGSPQDQAAAIEQAKENRKIASKKLARSNYWRWASLGFVWISLILFIVGCLFGANSVLGSR